MKIILSIFTFILISLSFVSCQSDTNVGSVKPPFIETGIDSDTWAIVKSGEFPFGQHDHMTNIDYDFEIMITDVTNSQYANFLNKAISAGKVNIGNVEVEAGHKTELVKGVLGNYKGEPFNNFKHEEEMKSGNKLLMPLEIEGLRLVLENEKFKAIPEYANHPVTMITWYGANAYCQFYGFRLPTEKEWEKSARGVNIIDGHGLPFPWGKEIFRNNANYYSSFDLLEKISDKLGNTTPVGFYNGKTYSGYKTLESKSPYGLYDMAGNVWQWMGDDYQDQHYRYLRGGSYYTYEVDLRVWKNNSAHPTYYSPQVGFRCVKKVEKNN